jgi:hypothetical protein
VGADLVRLLGRADTLAAIVSLRVSPMQQRCSARLVERARREMGAATFTAACADDASWTRARGPRLSAAAAQSLLVLSRLANGEYRDFVRTSPDAVRRGCAAARALAAAWDRHATTELFTASQR